MNLKKTKDVKLSGSERTALQKEIKKALQESHYSQGIGFASYSPATQEEQDYWTLERRYKKEDQLQQAKLENYQNAQRFLDFRSFEWFHKPAQKTKVRASMTLCRLYLQWCITPLLLPIQS